MRADPDAYYMPYQFGNVANPRAHYETTGPEILRDLPEVDVFVAGLGTGGTLTGAGRYLKERKPDVKVIATVPHPGDLVQGLRSLEDGFIPEVFDESVLDGRIVVDLAHGLRRRQGAHAEGGHLRRHLVGGGAAHGPAGGAAPEERATSFSSWPTGAGSTSPPSSGPRSTRTCRRR